MEEDSHSSQYEHQESQPQNHLKFIQSLQELKDLCSQLHAAAGYCESTFLTSKHKHLVVESTKEYVCKAVVAVVDHLGSVSANLDHHISEAQTDTISQTQVKIDLLNQMLVVWVEPHLLILVQAYEYTISIMDENVGFSSTPTVLRVISTTGKPTVSDVLTQNSGSEIVANTINSKQSFKIDEEVPLFFYTCIYKSASSKSSESTSENNDKRIVPLSLPVLPVRDNLSNQSKPQALSFQLQEKRTSRRGTLFKKSTTSNEILSIIRRRK